MNDTTAWSISLADRDELVGVAFDEPSHIHIPRPSRRARAEARSGTRFGDHAPSDPPSQLRLPARDSAVERARPAAA
jgi:hypothetical protein